MPLGLTRKSILLKSAANLGLHALRAAETRPVDKLDRVYTKLVLGKRATQRGDKLRKKR